MIASDAVFRHLPAVFRKAGEGSPAWPLAAAQARALQDFDRSARQVLRSRFLDDLGELDEAARLGALYDLAPWPEEDLPVFRRRLQAIIGVYLQGGATARRLLTVVAAAADADPALSADGRPALLLPGQSAEWPELVRGKRFKTDAFTTFALFRRRAAPDHIFGAAVVDLPTIERQIEVYPDSEGRCRWVIDNDLYGEPGLYDPAAGMQPDVWPDPVIEIEAGDHTVYMPVIVQHNLRRLVLVNRILYRGSGIRIDLGRYELDPAAARRRGIDIGGPDPVLRFDRAGHWARQLRPPTRFVPMTMAGLQGGRTERVPDRMYGTAGLLGRSRVSGKMPYPPAHVLRWYKRELLNWGSHLPPVPGVPGSTDGAPERLSWPSLLGEGRSEWELLVCTDRRGGTIDPRETISLERLHPVPPDPGSTPKLIRVRWIGRRAGSFTILVDPAELSHGHPHGPLPHRADWLREQAERLKPAGVNYIPQDETILSAAALQGETVG